MKTDLHILKDRPTISITMTRDSVCAGDDCDAPHEKHLDVPSFIDPQSLANQLASEYLPSVKGIGHTWECILNGRSIGTISITGFVAKVSEVMYQGNNSVHFKYNSSVY
jgi:hypothetical protein